VSEDLEKLATDAEEIAAQEHKVASEARAMQRLRKRGWPWARILDRERPPGLVARLRATSRLLTQLTTRFSRMLATAMVSEGHSHREIARRLGITHQRVTALLKQSTSESDPS
jgi:DNA-binding MarR family transcriptional regulator